MRRNGEPAALVNNIANFQCRFPFQIRQRRADAKQVTISGRHFHSRQNQKIIHR